MRYPDGSIDNTVNNPLLSDEDESSRAAQVELGVSSPETHEDRQERMDRMTGAAHERIDSIKVKERLNRMNEIREKIKQNDMKIRSLDEDIQSIRESNGIVQMKKELDVVRAGPMNDAQDVVNGLQKKIDEIEWMTLNPVNHIRRLLLTLTQNKALEKRNAIADEYYKKEKMVSGEDQKAVGVLENERVTLTMSSYALERELLELEREDEKYVKREVDRIRAGMNFNENES